MSPQVMGPEIDSYQFSSLFDNKPSRCIANWKYSLVRSDPGVPDVGFETACQLLRNKNDLPLSAAFRFPNDNLSLLDIGVPPKKWTLG
jgi:hypothetical protein